MSQIRTWEMMKHKLTAILLLLIACLPAAADDLQAVDSLLQAFHQAPNSQRYVVGQEIVDICLAEDILSEQPIRLSASQPSDSVDFLVFLAAERFYYNHAYFAESLDYINRALPLAEHNDPAYHAMLLCDRGYCLYKQGQLPQAAEAEQEAMTFCMDHGQKLQLARAYLYLAIVNYSIPQVDQAKLFVQKAIETDRQLGVNNNTHNILGIACEIYSYAGDIDQAISYGQQAVDAARDIGFEPGVVNHLSQLSYAYNRQGDYQRGLETARKAVEAVEQMKIPDRNLLAISLEYEAYNLLDMKRNAEAVPILLRAIDLEREVGNLRSVCYDYKALAEAYEPDQPRLAIDALRQYSRMADSIHNAALNDALSAADARFHNYELQQENSQQRQQKWFILIAAAVIALVLLGVIAVMSYVNYLRRVKNKRLLELQQAREEFFTNVTHEFRTPLTVIQGLSRQLQQPDPQRDEEQTATTARIIEQQGSRLLAFVNRLLDMGRMSAAIDSTQWQRGDVVPLLSMITDSFRQIASDKSVQLNYEHRQQSQVIDYEPEYLNKIIGNLLSNALKYTHAGGQVNMESRLDGDHFILTVQDNGQGIAPEEIKHIFSPFYRAKAAMAEQGTGIGLTLTRQLVEAAQGTISVESELGHGTLFTVTLPQHQQGRQMAAATNIVIKPVPESVRDYQLELVDSPLSDDDENGRQRLLVVEDNHEVAFYIGSILSPHYDVFYAEDGAAGLEKATELVPDLVLTDLMMPQMDGLQFCREMRRQSLTCHIPIIIITAKARQEDCVQGLRAGASAYLVKPFDAEELLVRVATLLERQHLLQQKYLREKLAFQSSAEGDSAVRRQPDYMSTDESEFENLSADHVLDRISELVVQQMNNQQPVTIEALAGIVGLSYAQLRRKINAVTGLPPARYILSLRIEKAKELLARSPGITISEAAYRTGFSDNSHFTKVFRRITGLTPLQFVNGIKNDQNTDK